jgi:hypothetical protein
VPGAENDTSASKLEKSVQDYLKFLDNM